MRTHFTVILSLIVFGGCYGSYQSDTGMTGDGGTGPEFGTATGGNTAQTPPVVDNDHDDDGHDSVASGGDDCNDADAAVNPDMVDDSCDGIDQDCSGVDGDSPTFRSASACGGVDGDGDGVMDQDGEGNDVDCNDDADDVFPGAPEIPYDGIDQDCNGADLRDADGDGHEAETVGGDDCDDGNPDINPDATEVPDNGINEDCNPANDTSGDADGDGFTVGDGDCNDTDAAVNPDATDIPNNGVDEDCSGWDLGDVDCDGWSAENEAGDIVDCNDADPDVHPEALEVMGDGIDNDGDPATLDAAVEPDSDGDGSLDIDDCADTDPLRFPGATEVADDGIDQDCDGVDLVTVIEPDPCTGGYSWAHGTFTGPADAVIVSISGERVGTTNGDDYIGWSVWTTGTPIDMVVTNSANVAEFSFERCVDDAADWKASVSYTLPNVADVQYDCMNDAFTGTWSIDFNGDIQTVTVSSHASDTGCDAAW